MGRTKSKICKATVAGLHGTVAEFVASSAAPLLADLAGFLDTCEPTEVVWINSTVTGGLLDIVASRLRDIDDEERYERICEEYHESGESLDPYERRAQLRVGSQVGEQTARYVGINNDIYALIVRPDNSRML